MSPLDRYTCEQAFERLNDYIDRELTPDEMRLVREHLEICVQCAEEFKFQVSVINAVKARMRQLEIPMDSLLSRVAQSLDLARRESAC